MVLCLYIYFFFFFYKKNYEFTLSKLHYFLIYYIIYSLSQVYIRFRLLYDFVFYYSLKFS